MEAEAVEALRAARIRKVKARLGKRRSLARRCRSPILSISKNATTSRLRPLLNRLGYRSLLTVPLLREQQIMGGLTVWRRQAGEFAHGSGELAANLRDPVGPGDPERAAVSRDRGERPGAGGGQPAQVGISRQYVTRAAHAAQRDHRLLGSVAGAPVRRAERQTSRIYRRHSFLRPPFAVPDQ